MIAGNLGNENLEMNCLNQTHCNSPLFPTNSKQTLPIIIHSNLRRLAAWAMMTICLSRSKSWKLALPQGGSSTPGAWMGQGLKNKKGWVVVGLSDESLVLWGRTLQTQKTVSQRGLGWERTVLWRADSLRASRNGSPNSSWPTRLMIKHKIWSAQILLSCFNHHHTGIKKQRYYFANKGPSSQGYGFSSSHVWMWELDYKESWAPKNWCFWTVVLEKTLESPLDCKEIQPAHPKGNQSWIFIGRTDGWSQNSNSLATWYEELTHWKRPWGWERLKAGGEEGNRGWDAWMASLTRWTWVWASSGSWW